MALFGFMEEEYLNYTNEGEEVLLSQEVMYIALAVAIQSDEPSLWRFERHCNGDESGDAVVSVRLRMENPEDHGREADR